MTQEKQIEILLATLNECLEFFHDNMDVVDGDDGQPEPDAFMQMATHVDQQIKYVLGKPIW